MKTKILWMIVLTSTVALAACTSAPTPSPTTLPPSATSLPLTATTPPPTMTPTPSPTLTPTPTESPDEEVLREYFNELYLTNLQETTIFNAGDKICPVLDIKKEMQGTVILYDTLNRREINRSGFYFQEDGNYQFCGYLSQFTLPSGKYEIKIRIGGKLAAIVPFVFQTDDTEVPALSEQPDSETYKE
ncbi:MAG: hypothetical protein AB1345_06575 [Chloroflexota bacterium]